MSLFFEHEVEYFDETVFEDALISYGEFAEWGYVNDEFTRYKLEPIETDYLISPDRKSNPNSNPKDYLHVWNV